MMVIAMVPSDFVSAAYADAAIPVSDAEGFAAMEADGSYILTDDITVEAPYASAFTGTFDGDGHTVTLDITASSANTGMFKQLGSGATVKNLVLEGSVTSTGNNTGAVVGRVDPDAADVTIENCLNKAEIQGSRYVGGIVGCGNYGDYRIIIESCGNEANISSTGNQVGGIIGKIEGGTISNCYNTGIVKGDNQRAGIVGQALAYADSGYPYTVHVSTEISNCYSTGTIQAKEGSSNKGYPIVGAGNANKKATVTNCYALSGTGEGDGLLPPQSSGNDVVTATNCDYKTSEFMQSADFVSLLGDAFERGATYPELVAINAMQTPTASVTFTLSPADATLVIDGTKTVNGGATRTVNLAAGDHTWVVSAEGCTSQDGSISVSEDQANTAATLDGVSVTLAKDASQFSTITFETTPANATVVVKKGETVMEPSTDGGKTYELLNTKTYTYEASTTTEGYEAATGDVDLSSATNTIALKHVESIAVSGNEASYYVGTTEEQLRSSLTVTATYNDRTTATVTGFTVSGFDVAEPAENHTVTISYKGASTTFTADFSIEPTAYAALAGKAIVTPIVGSYGFVNEITEGGVLLLKSNNQSRHNTSAIMTITPISEGTLTFKYKIGSENSDKLYMYKESESEGAGQGGKKDWTSAEYNLSAGQTFYIKYTKDYSVDSNGDTIYLKDFSFEKKYSVTITPDIDGTTIVLKDSEQNLVTGENGVYSLPAGTYSYTITKFRYEEKTGTITVVDSDVTENVTMTALSELTVTFDITLPSGVSGDASIVVKHGADVMTANPNGTYSLTAGEYTYTVSHANCAIAEGTFTVSNSNVTVPVALKSVASLTITGNRTGYYIGTPEDSLRSALTVTANYSDGSSEAVTGYTVSGFDVAVPAENHTITISYKGASTTFAADFTVRPTAYSALAGKATVDCFAGDTNGGSKYGFADDELNGEIVLKSNNQGQGNKAAVMTITPNSSGVLRFKYKISSEAKYDLLYLGNVTSYSDNTEKLKWSGAIDWTQTSVNVAAGETFKITYKKDSSGNSGDDTVWLKDFAFDSAYTLAFTNIADGANLTLTKNGETVAPASAGTYTLADGTYAYTESKFGYEDLTGTVTVSGADQTVDLPAMTAAASKTLTFSIPDGASIAVSHETEGDMAGFASGNVFTLPAGETYSYTVSKEGFVSVRGRVVLDDNRTLTISLANAGAAWDGAAKTVPQQDANGTYLIGSGAELAWFADYVNTTNGSINAKLTANINLGGRAWTPIGSDNAFEGVFDGNGKTISGIPAAICGIFSKVGTADNHSATVKNLSVNGTISNSSDAGGIISQLYGIAENCSFTGSITTGGRAGGIAARMEAGGRISGCAVNADITNTNTYFNQTLEVGGITGYIYGIVENSYFVGSVAANITNSSGRTLTNKAVGGITGRAAKSYGSNSPAIIRNCYVSASVTGPADGISAFVWYEAANANDVSVTNCYYENKGLTDGKATAKTGSEMRARAFVSALNGSGSVFNQDITDLNGGFPVLAWQGGSEVFDADARAVSLDKTALTLSQSEVREACNLTLPASGANGTTIAWASDNASVISNSGAVVLPQSGRATVTLTATITKNEARDTKTFSITVYSGSATNQARLDAIASYVNGRSVWASEIVHPDERTTVDVIKRFVSASGRDINGLTFTMTSPGTKSLPANEDVNIASDGTINYFTGVEGSSSYKSALYNDVAFTVSNGTESASFTCRMFISWDKEYVEGVLGSLANQITWNTIRGENATSSAVTSNLALPEGIGTASVTWQASYDQSEGELVTIERALQNENYYQRVNVIRPAGADLPVRLTGTFRFNLTNRDELPGEADFSVTKTFDFTVAKDASQAQVDTARTQQSLESSFEGLITYFYGDMGEQLRLDAVKGDLQLPQPRALETSGIFQNRSSQRITYTSLTPEVMSISGYHAIIYRPLPGAESETARLKATISSRDTGRVQGEATFEFTVLPFTQAEINADKAYMARIATDAVYVAGLLRDTENTPSAIVANLKNFSFITEENGEIVYNSGSGFGGSAVKLADLPGYDPMSSLMWRTIRSSRPTILTDENLLLTKPEYDTQLILESCMTMEKYSAYGDRFTADSTAYASYSIFEDLYKVPVSATVTVKGLRGADPNAASRPNTMSVNVKVDGRDFGGFENITSWTYTGSTLRDHTAWDALRGALSANGYGYTGSGTYVRSLTDSHGHELGEFDFGQNSGWLYTVGGVLPDLALAQYYLEDGDRMVFYYTGEYTREPGVREKMKEAAKEELAVPETGAEIVKKEEKTDALGSKIVTVTDVNGKQASSVQLSDEAVKKAEASGKPIEIAVSAAKPEADAKKAAAVNVILPKGKEKAAVSIPVKEAETTTVLMKVNADGSFTPIVTSVVNEEGTGVVATVEDGSYIVVDNKVEFEDVKKDAWYEAGVNFAASRGLMVGVGEGKFAQETALTTAQTAAVIGRIKGEGTSESWEKAVEKFGKAEVNNRQNTISMLYEAYKEIGGSEVAVNADALITFRDSSDISAENLEAVRWAVAAGLINGVGDDLIDPLGELTRGQFGTMLERFIKLLAGIQ